MLRASVRCTNKTNTAVPRPETKITQVQHAAAVTMPSDSEMASPSRSTRKKPRINYSEEKIIEEEEATESTKQHRVKRSRNERDADGESEAGSEGDESEASAKDDAVDEQDSDAEPVKKKSKPGKKGRGPASDRTCEYCNKVCVSKSGLKYHIGK